MRKVVGIDRKIKRAWVDTVLDRLAQTTDESDLRSFVDNLLQEDLPGKESRAKTTGILLRIWSGIPSERTALRDRAVAMLPRIPGQERIWLHWGMTALAYPFFRDTAEVVGRLLALQDDFTTAQVQGRMLTTWGDRATSKEAAQKLITTLVDWEVLRSTKVKGHFLLARKMTASIPDLQLWLLEAMLAASAADEIEAQQLLRLPESFPFTISIGVADLRRYEGFNIHRQGLDMDMVALRPFRVPLPVAPPSSPIPNPKPEPARPTEPVPIAATRSEPEPPKTFVAASIQPSLFDLPIEDVGTEDEVTAPVVESAIPTPTEPPRNVADIGHVSEVIHRFSSDRELLKSTAYQDGGLAALLARLERAAANQAEGGQATFSRYAIWANTVRDHISEALRLLRECGDQEEAERLLIAAHNSLSAFSEIQALFDPSRIGQSNTIVPDLFQKAAQTKTTKARTKSKIKSNSGDNASLPLPDAPLLDGLAGMKALSVRQPHAEAIFRGRKTADDRSSATKTRGRILIYASLSRYGAEDEAEMMKEYGIEDVGASDLPRGVLIGTVELHNSEGGRWYLRTPERLDTPIKPTKQPKPVWFNPF